MAGSSHQRVIFPDFKLKICLFLCLIGIVSASDLTSSATTAAISALPLPDKQLSPTFYALKCPMAIATINAIVTAAVFKEPRMGASLLRLHFHDCFVQFPTYIIHLLHATAAMLFDIQNLCVHLRFNNLTRSNPRTN
ncbi:Cationic peroxidase 1, partial [Mucuna pruriens]